MASDGATILRGYKHVDKLLAAEPGGHATSPAWMAFLERWLLSGKTRAVASKGRQGGASEVMGGRLAVAIALFGEHRAPPGTRLRILFISTRQKEADEKLYATAHVLGVLGEPHKRTGDSIELLAKPIVFQSYPCREDAVRGGTCIYVLEDEMASWRSDETSANPAHRIDAAILPSGITQPNFRIASVSSPMGAEDFHAQLFDRGETENQCVAHGPSWYWNPAISEAATRAIQPDERAWKREFAAIRQGSSLSAFDPEAIATAFEVPALDTLGMPVIPMDAAGRGSDSFVWAIGGWARAKATLADRFLVLDVPGEPDLVELVRDANGAPARNPAWTAPLPFLYVTRFKCLDGSYRSGITAGDIAKLIAQDAQSVGARLVVCDNYESFGFESLLAQFGLRLNAYAWGGQSKPRAVERLRRMLNDKAIKFARCEPLRRELLAFEERIGANGITYGAGKDPTGGHFDHLSAVLTLVMADAAGDLYASPTRRSSNIIEGTKAARSLNPFQGT